MDGWKTSFLSGRPIFRSYDGAMLVSGSVSPSNMAILGIYVNFLGPTAEETWWFHNEWCLKVT